MSNAWEIIGSYISENLKGITPKYVESSNTVVLNQKCIRDNRIDYSFAQFVSEEQKISKDKYLREGDILINSTGQGTAGRVAFVETLPVDKEVTVDSHILILRIEDKLIANLIRYNLFYFESTLMTFMDGSSGQGEFDRVRLFSTKFKLPNKLQQYAVSTLLLTLDKKIETNNKIIKELEAMAKELYDYWFVQFDFPDANGKPYRTSGGKMTYSPILKRETPNNWEVKSLNDLVEHKTDSIIPNQFPNKNFRYYSIPAYDSKDGRYIIEKGKQILSNKFAVSSKAILISKLNPRYNRVAFSENANNQICTTEFVVLEPFDGLKSFLYYSAKSIAFIQYCTSGAAGTSNSHKRIDPELMLKYSIPYNEEIAKKFELSIKCCIDKVIVAKNNNEQLCTLRDWLLPMLMNGQVTICAENNNEVKEIKRPKVINLAQNQDKRFEIWMQNQALAARGDIDKTTLREIFDAMDDDDK